MDQESHLAYPHLFESFQLGPLTLKNRLVMAPLATGLENTTLKDPRLIKFYSQRVQNHGPGMVIIGGLGINTMGKRHPLMKSPTCHSWHEAHYLSDTLHQHDTKIIAQLMHQGLDVMHPFPLGASRVFHPDTEKYTYRIPSLYIQVVIEQYVRHAKHITHDAHFDGIEIYAGNRSLPNTFCTPALNRRHDKWGLNHGLLFVERLTNKVRKAIGHDKALLYRLNLMDLTPSGQTFENLIHLGHTLENAGVDGFSFEIGLSPNQVPVACELTPPGVWLPFMEAFANEMHVPVIYGKKLPDPETTNEFLKQHPYGLAEYARNLIADPHWAQKVYENKLEDIVPCVECPQRCIAQTLLKDKQIYCISCPEALDPESELLRETEPEHVQPPTFADDEEGRDIEPYEFPDVLVIGGGPAGMAAARQAALDGYTVTLVDEHEELGGLYRLCGMIPGRDQVNVLLDQQKANLEALGVHIVLGTQVDLDWIQTHAPDSRLILATGTTSSIPDIPGIDSPNVYTFEELLKTTVTRRNHIAIVGRNTLALDIARFFCPKKSNNAQQWLQAWGVDDLQTHQGGVKGVVPKLFTTVRSIYLMLTMPLDDLEGDLKRSRRHYELKWLRMNGVRTFSNVRIEQIDNHFLRYRHLRDNETNANQQTAYGVLPEGFEAGDDLFVVVADGIEPRLDLAQSLDKEGKAYELAGSLKYEERLWGAGLSAFDGMMVARHIKEREL